MDVESGDADDEINVSMYKGPKKNWKSEQYIKEHSVDMHMLFRMIPLPLTFILMCIRMPSLLCFLITKFSNTCKYIERDFVSGFPIRSGLVPIFKELLLYECCKNKCDWNDNIIFQFYATVQNDFVKWDLYLKV
jgi:hypothetical protein